MYNQNIKIRLNRGIVEALLKKVKSKNLEEYINQKLKEDLNK